MPFAVEEKWAGVISSRRSPCAGSLVPGCGPHPAVGAEVPGGCQLGIWQSYTGPSTALRGLQNRESPKQRRKSDQNLEYKNRPFLIVILLSDGTGIAPAWQAAPSC